MGKPSRVLWTAQRDDGHLGFRRTHSRHAWLASWTDHLSPKPTLKAVRMVRTNEVSFSAHSGASLKHLCNAKYVHATGSPFPSWPLHIRGTKLYHLCTDSPRWLPCSHSLLLIPPVAIVWILDKKHSSFHCLEGSPWTPSGTSTQVKWQCYTQITLSCTDDLERYAIRGRMWNLQPS